MIELPIAVGSVFTRALLDSGATHNFISRSFMNRCGLVPRSGSLLEITLADGTKQRSAEEVATSFAFVLPDDRTVK